MGRAKFVLRFCVFIIVLTILLWRTGGAQAASWRTGRAYALPPMCKVLRIIPCVRRPTLQNTKFPVGTELVSVTALASNNVWGVGDNYDPNAKAEHTLIENWNGSHWSIKPSPNPGTLNALSGIVALSANNIWAVGGFVNNNSPIQTLIEHWNGSSWSVVPSPNVPIAPYNYLLSVAAASPNDIWAVGYFYPTSSVPYQILIEHWDGSRWSIIPGPDPGGPNIYNLLYEATAISSNDVWAVGYYENTNTIQPITEHWNGSAWFIVPNVNITYAYLFGVKASSSNNVIAIGDSWNGTNWQALTEHWNGTSWNSLGSTTVGASLNNAFYEITGLLTNDIWSVGASWSSNGPDQTLTEHWNGKSWSVVSSKNFGSNVTNDLYGVAGVSSNDVWAIGRWDAGNGNFQVLTEHWDGSQWNIVAPGAADSSLQH